MIVLWISIIWLCHMDIHNWIVDIHNYRVYALLAFHIGEVPYCFSRSSVKFQGHTAKKIVTIIARSLAVSEWRAPASVTSPVWKNPIHRNPFLIINQIHKYTQMTHTYFVTYECIKLLCVSLTRFYHDSFSFKENTYPVLNQRHISVDIRTAPLFTGAKHARSRFSKPTLPQRAACCVLSQVTFLLSPPGKVFQVNQGSRGFCLIPRSTGLTIDMTCRRRLRTLSQDLPYRLRPEQTTVLEQLGQDRHVFVSLPTGYGKSECLTVFPKLMDLLRPYESNSSSTWSYLWGGLVRGKK